MTRTCAEQLSDMNLFLEHNPGEVITLFAESAVTPAELATTFATAGLLPYLYVHDFARGWPTLSEMAQHNTRLVVFNDSQDKSRPAWQHYLYDLIVDTDYNITDITQFRCAFYRGRPENSLYFINQFIYAAFGNKVLFPDPKLAQKANEPAFVSGRAQQCWTETQRIPNFIYVDWFEKGDVMAAVRALNRLPRQVPH